MYTRAFVKNLILPSISVGVVRAEGKEDECDDTRKLVRPRDLALYVDPPKCVTCSNTVESEDGFLLTTVRCARQELQSVLDQARVIQAEASTLLDNIKKETSDAVSYLQQEENLLPRMGAIGLGAFAGYILAARKGILKKLLYTATGAGAVAAVAYPNEARDITEEVMCELKKYAVIGYHFVNGADVDWKKLNEATRPPCFGKNGKSGSGPAGSAGSQPPRNNRAGGSAGENAPYGRGGGNTEKYEPYGRGGGNTEKYEPYGYGASTPADAESAPPAQNPLCEPEAADVDWKKLNEQMRCLQKNGITGGTDGGAQGKSGKAEPSPADSNQREENTKPGSRQSDRDGLPRTKPGSKNETAASTDRAGDAPKKPPDQGKDDDDSSKAKQGNAASNDKPCAETEEPLPQERPKNSGPPRKYKSYSEECKARAKTPCNRERSTSNGGQNEFHPRSRGSSMTESSDARGGRRQDVYDQYSDGSEYSSPPQRAETAPGSRRGDLAEPRGRSSDLDPPPVQSAPDRDEQGMCDLGDADSDEQRSTSPDASPDSYYSDIQPGPVGQPSGSSGQDACTLDDSNDRPVNPNALPDSSQSQTKPSARPRTNRSRVEPAQPSASPRYGEPNDSPIRGGYPSQPYRAPTGGDGPELPCKPESSQQQGARSRYGEPDDSGRPRRSQSGEPDDSGRQRGPRSQSAHEPRQRPQSRESPCPVAEGGPDESSVSDCKGGYCMRRRKARPTNADS